jgi:hypothetical protein
MAWQARPTNSKRHPRCHCQTCSNQNSSTLKKQRQTILSVQTQLMLSMLSCLKLPTAVHSSCCTKHTPALIQHAGNAALLSEQLSKSARAQNPDHQQENYLALGDANQLSSLSGSVSAIVLLVPGTTACALACLKTLASAAIHTRICQTAG